MIRGRRDSGWICEWDGPERGKNRPVREGDLIRLKVYNEDEPDCTDFPRHGRYFSRWLRQFQRNDRNDDDPDPRAKLDVRALERRVKAGGRLARSLLQFRPLAKSFVRLVVAQMFMHLCERVRPA